MAGSLWQWRVTQTIGDGEGIGEDAISCMRFNDNGQLLAVGDKGGIVSVLCRHPSSDDVEYSTYSRFQSHVPEFDCLQSTEISERITDVQWVGQTTASSHLLLSTNTKVVKLWKIAERCKELDGSNLEGEIGRPQTVTSLQLPVLKTVTKYVEASQRRIYNSVHGYYVHSLSVNSDQETFLSADDLRINIWHLNFTSKHFTVVDLKPETMGELEEVMTSAKFHPTECNLFVYSSTKGALRLCDMRSQALCDRNGKLFSAHAGEKHLLSEIISSATDVKFSHGGQYLMSRDFLTVKVWDVRMETQPVEVHQVHPYLRSKLYNLYESECLVDRFECNWSADDRHILTGTYNDFFRIFDRDNHKDVTLGVSKGNFKSQQLLRPKKVFLSGPKNRKDEINVDAIDTGKKVLSTLWHPSENIIAVASSNRVYLIKGSEL